MIEQATSPSCIVCRRRKIKCDRTPGSCNKCRTLGEKCLYSTPSTARVTVIDDAVHPSNSMTQAGLKRRRILRSCLECRRTKSKCSGGPVCDRCRKKEIECCFDDTDPDLPSSPSRAIPTWLASRNLPPLDQMRELIDVYFSHIHSVRCMGFLHIPSFMERFHDSNELYTEKSGLVYIMCALAAPFMYAQAIASIGVSPDVAIRFFNAGKGWADNAMQCMFSDFGNPSIECLMTEILLHEYYLRIGDYSKAFLISGFISRRMQLLQLNVEDDKDIWCQKNENSWAAKETRRRLLWACYLLDASIECGTDQLRFMSADTVQVQLPCAEDSFIRNSACITEMLPIGKVLPFVDQSLAKSAAYNIDLRGYYIRAMAIRSNVLRYVKHLDDESPWEANSKFYALDKELQDMDNSIPESLKISTENTHTHKSSRRLNLFFGLHILISQTYNDLHRVGVSNLGIPNTSTQWIRENAPKEFTSLCYRTCISKALYIGSLLSDLWHGHRLSMVDSPYVAHAQICSSVLVACLASWADPELTLSYHDCHQILQTNVEILKYLAMYIKADLYYESAIQALRQFESLFSDKISGGRVKDELPSLSIVTSNNKNSSTSQFSLQFILNPPTSDPGLQREGSCHSESSDDAKSAQTDILHSARHQYNYASDINYASSPPDQRRYSYGAADSLPSPDGSMSPSSNWPSEISIMGGMGYPNFLQNLM